MASRTSTVGLVSMTRGQGVGGPLRLDILGFGAGLLRRLPPNAAHRLAIRALRYGLAPRLAVASPPALATRVWDLDFANPVGLAAGFDKDAEAVDALLGLGFGFVEAGTVTPRPQSENTRPNLFRLDADAAVINRLGFPSQGLEPFARRLARPRINRGVVGVNVGINRDSTDPAGDFAACIARLAPVADYLVINVSSPNTAGLRDLQRGASIAEIIARAREARDRAAGVRQAPLIIKIAPDLDDDGLADVARAALDGGVDGLCAGNTSVARPAGLLSPAAREPGGFSGPALFQPSTRVLAALYRLTEGRLPLIGCGGVSSGADAYAKIRAGASLVQLYTALIYRGPGIATAICGELADRLAADGFACVADAVGADHR